MKRREQKELILASSESLNGVLTALDHLPKATRLQSAEAIRRVEKELGIIGDALKEGAPRDALKHLSKVLSLTDSGEHTECIRDEPAWLANLGACGDLGALLSRVAMLRDQLDVIAEWQEDDVRPKLKRNIANDISALTELSDIENTPNCAQARSFLAIRAIEGVVYMLQLEAGRTLEQIEKDKHWVDADLLKEFPALAKAFNKPDIVYCQRASVIHVKLAGDDALSELDWILKLLRVCGVLWWDRTIGEALQRVQSQCQIYAAGLSAQIETEKNRKETELRRQHADETRLGDGQAAIAAKRSSLQDQYSDLARADGDVALCEDRVGACQHYGGGTASIYWHPVHGAHLIFGPIRQQWMALSDCRGCVGYPKSDMQVLRKAAYLALLRSLECKPRFFTTALRDVECGKYVEFERGILYWFGEKWQAEAGGETVAVDLGRKEIGRRLTPGVL